MMTRREAIKAVALTAGALAVAPSLLQGQTSDSSVGSSTYPFKLAPLGYPYDALEPYIDALTMQIHHDKHNGAYVENLNKAIAQAPEAIQKMSLDELLRNLDKFQKTSEPQYGTTPAANTIILSFGRSSKRTREVSRAANSPRPSMRRLAVIQHSRTNSVKLPSKCSEAVGPGWSQTAKNSRLPRRRTRIFLSRNRIRKKLRLSASTFGSMPTTSNTRIAAQNT